MLAFAEPEMRLSGPGCLIAGSNQFAPSAQGVSDSSRPHDACRQHLHKQASMASWNDEADNCAWNFLRCWEGAELVLRSYYQHPICADSATEIQCLVTCNLMKWREHCMLVPPGDESGCNLLVSSLTTSDGWVTWGDGVCGGGGGGGLAEASKGSPVDSSYINRDEEGHT